MPESFNILGVRRPTVHLMGKSFCINDTSFLYRRPCSFLIDTPPTSIHDIFSQMLTFWNASGTPETEGTAKVCNLSPSGKKGLKDDKVAAL